MILMLGCSVGSVKDDVVILILGCSWVVVLEV